MGKVKERELARYTDHVGYGYVWLDGGEYTTGPYQEFLLSYLHEKISYEDSHKRQYNYCHHEKTRFSADNPGPSVKTLYWASNDWVSLRQSFIHCDAVADEVSDMVGSPPFSGWVSPPDYNFDELMILAFQDMKPQIKELMSGVVSLLELEDIASTIQSARRLGTLMRRYLTSVKQMKRFNFTMRDLISTVSDSTLAYKFGVRPIVSDTVAVLQSISTYVAKFEKLWDGQRRPMVARWRAPLDRLSPSMDIPYIHEKSENNGTKAVVEHKRRTSTWDNRSFNVTMKCTYELRDALGYPVSKETASRLGRLDQLGVNLDPSIIWDKIPYSFVVDWLVDVGGWLEQFERKLLNSVITIQDLCYTYKYEQIMDVDFWTTPNPGYTQYEESWQHAKVRRTVFHRDRLYPKALWLHGTASPSLSALTADNWIVGAMLAVQRCT